MNRPTTPGNLTRVGSGTPSAGLGQNGDIYIDELTGRHWEKISGSWGLMFQPTLPASKITGQVVTGQVADGSITTVKIADANVTALKIAAALFPSGGAAAGAEAFRALGATASTAAAGNDARLSDTRTPTDGSVSYVKLGTSARAQASTITAINALFGGSVPPDGNRAVLATSNGQVELIALGGHWYSANPLPGYSKYLVDGGRGDSGGRIGPGGGGGVSYEPAWAGGMSLQVRFAGRLHNDDTALTGQCGIYVLWYYSGGGTIVGYGTQTLAGATDAYYDTGWLTVSSPGNYSTVGWTLWVNNNGNSSGSPSGGSSTVEGTVSARWFV